MMPSCDVTGPIHCPFFTPEHSGLKRREREKEGESEREREMWSAK
jgi:hypothetical protein